MKILELIFPNNIKCINCGKEIEKENQKRKEKIEKNLHFFLFLVRFPKKGNGFWCSCIIKYRKYKNKRAKIVPGVSLFLPETN